MIRGQCPRPSVTPLGPFSLLIGIGCLSFQCQDHQTLLPSCSAFWREKVLVKELYERMVPLRVRMDLEILTEEETSEMNLKGQSGF